jgi:hypothetical protein
MEQGKKQKGDKLSLGKHLLQFLKFWSEFDFVKTGIYLKNGGGFFQKVRTKYEVLLFDLPFK